MKVISWNMAAGFRHDAARHDRAWEWLADQNADVCLVQEVIVPSSAFDRWGSVVFASKYSKPWGSAVLTRAEGYERYEPAPNQPFLHHLQGAACVARPPSPELPWLISIHSSATSYTSSELQKPDFPSLEGVARCSDQGLWEMELAIHELGPMLQGTTFIAGGDLNSALLFDTKYGGQENERLFANIKSAGFYDLRPAESPEQRTFFRPGTGDYQLDHVYADSATAGHVSSWHVVSVLVDGEDAPSDHAPIIVTLEPGVPAPWLPPASATS